MSVKVEVQHGDLQEAAKKLANPGNLLHSIGQYLVSSTQARIRTTKTDPDGKPWAPWAPGTYLARAKAGTLQGGLLLNSGRLLNSVGYRVSGKTLEVEATAPYAGFLQNGTPRMPARPFLGISKGDETAINNMLSRFLRSK